MRTLFEHIEIIKQKPHDTRRQIAFAAAFGCTTLVALVWLVGTVSTGTFAIHGSSFADRAGQGPSLSAQQDSSNANLLGAASAAKIEASAPARIDIVNTATSSTFSGKSGGPQAEQTVIPF